jgi:hypothetical protein
MAWPRIVIRFDNWSGVVWLLWILGVDRRQKRPEETRL